MNNGKKRSLTEREKLLFKIFFLTALIAYTAAGFIRFHLRYTELNGRITAQRELIQTTARSTDTASPAALRRKRDALSARLGSFAAETSPDAYSLGESVLKLLREHSVTIRRYRPLTGQSGESRKDVPGFSFAGNTAVGDLLRFLQKLSQEHSCWNVTSLMISASSTPGHLDIAFDIVQGPKSPEAKE
ncbi:hypothetical protein [Marispirochaeta aestuarii]|uniref:hypothetical protein n=1 Tax=Marispirochaeta aestuarii TaxID=1963862 RepID=UPI0029C96E47|nr:hypothetical protein [Marispirochaeta aestuarii]